MRTFVIGRSAHADAPLAEPGVARRHLELTESDDGRWYAVDAAGPDRVGEAQTWRWDEPAGAWAPLRQDFVATDDRLRLGVSAEWRVSALIATAERRRAAEADGREDGRTGRVERDPATGEIVRRAE